MLMSLLALAAQAECAATIFEGRIETPTETYASVTMRGGRVLSMSKEGAPDDADPACVITLGENQTAFPGLTDSHVHLLGIGLREMNLNLDRARSIEDVKRALAEKAAAQPEGVIIGRGWIETGWPEGRPLTASDLDEVVSDRPVLLTRADGHALAANSAALEEADIGPGTEDPDGGRIVRDEEGAATGYLIDAAMDLVVPLMPELTEERRREGLRLGAETYASRGWTGVHNMSVEPEDLPLLEELAAEGALPLRVANFVVPEAMESLIEEGPGCDPKGLVCHLGVKFYADGALGSRGALLKEPYADEPETTGLRLLSKEDALPAYAAAAEGGLQITTHAIGDRANKDILDWYAEVRDDHPDATLRIEHAQIVDPEDLDLFAERGVIASMQPSHAIGDLHFAPARLGMKRLEGAYAWNSLASEGTLIVFGSDAPVEQGDPRIELYAAHVRKDLEGFSDKGWHPEEALTRAETLALFTTAPALAIGRGGSMGTLAPGFTADFSVFEGDPFEGPQSARAVATILNGKVVSGQL